MPDKNARINWEELEGPPQKYDMLGCRDMEETKKVNRNFNQRVCGITDIKMLDRLDNAKKFESPAAVVLARGI